MFEMVELHKKGKVVQNMSQELIKRAGEIIYERGISWETGSCVLGLINENGYPTVSTLSIAQADGIKWITFGTGLEGNKAKRIAKNNRASVCLNSVGLSGETYNITLVGTIEILTDPAIKKEMWYEGLEHHFSGADDPDYCVLRFNTEFYNLFIGEGEAEGAL